MVKPKGTGHNIAFAVAYKGAVELVANGIVQLETEDVGAELAELADVLFEHYSERLQEETPRGKGGGGRPRSSGRSSSSSSRGSSRSGYSKGGGGDRKPSAKQVAFLNDLARDRDHGYDVEIDGDDVNSLDGKSLEDFTGKEVSALIEELLQAPQL